MALEAVGVVKKLQEMRDGGYLSDPIMREAVIQIEKSDPKYDWVGIYLHNADEKMLWLHNYMGEPTEHAKIEVGQGVCGTAVAESKNQVDGRVQIQAAGREREPFPGLLQVPKPLAS